MSLMRQLKIESQTYRDKSTICSCTNLLCSDDVKIYFYYNCDCGCFDKRTSAYLFGADMQATLWMCLLRALLKYLSVISQFQDMLV